MNIKILHTSSLTPILGAAAICRNSNNPEQALEHALKAGHDSLLEHWVVGFKVEGVSRVLSHQLVRSRIGWSYAQQSQRHVEIDNGHDWYVDPDMSDARFHTHIEACRQGYKAAIAAGVSIEDARYLLPGACKTSLVITTNARALNHFFRLRCCDRAQAEIREFAYALLNQVRHYAPNLFGLYPKCNECKEKCK